MESQKESFPDGRVAKHHMGRRAFIIWNPKRGVLADGRIAKHRMGRRVLIIWSPKRGVCRRVGWPNTIWGGECVLYGVPIEGFSGRWVCQPPYGKERVCDVESQKEGFPDGQFAKHHMGKRMFIIWSPKRGVIRTLGLPTTIWGGECA